MNESLFLVDKKDFMALVERLYAEKIRTEKIEEHEHTTIKVYGIDSDDCICSHRWFNDENKPDEYYIFNLPDADMMTEPRARRHIQLNEEETEFFFTELVKIIKEKKKNERTV